jgi:hypothetical protein
MKLMSDEEDILRHEERLLGRQFLSSEDHGQGAGLLFARWELQF